MRYKVDDLKREIRIALDQNMSSKALSALGDVDTLSLEDIIESKLLPAARIVLLNAPTHFLGGGIPFGGSISWKGAAGRSAGSVLLPDNFLRLVVFQMSDWSRPVYSAITPSDPAYALQSSRYPGIRGNPQKPVVAVVNSGVGIELEFYSCTGGSGVAIKQATYIPEPRIIDGSIELSHKVKEAFVYHAAYLVAVSTQQSTQQGEQQSAQLLNLSNSLLTI